MVTRRDFLKSAAFSAAGASLLLAACSSDDDSSAPASTGTSGACDGAGATSSNVGGHTHDVCVARADITAAPGAGMTYTTTPATDGDGHTHTVTLTQAQLQTLSSGGTLAITSSLDSQHTHDFSLKES